MTKQALTQCRKLGTKILGGSAVESNKALAEIAGIRDRELRAGGVDSERDDFEMIIEAVRSGTMTPHAGVVQARTLASRRQDYH